MTQLQPSPLGMLRLRTHPHGVRELQQPCRGPLQELGVPPDSPGGARFTEEVLSNPVTQHPRQSHVKHQHHPLTPQNGHGKWYP